MSNTSPRAYSVLQGSERKLPGNAHSVGPVDPNELIEVSLYLRAPATQNLSHIVSQGRRLSRKEYNDSYSASPEDIEKVKQFASEHDLTIIEENLVTRKIVLAGTAADMTNAFKTQLHYYETPGGRFRGRVGSLQVPSDLNQIVEGVFGLDDRPQARPYFQLSQAEVNAKATAASYTPTQLAQLYNFPTNVNGAGQCIAIIELGGGFRQSDLQTYFRQLSIPLPTVSSVSVDGGSNRPVGNPRSADGEVDLDIEVAGGIAPGARIVVYFAPNTDRGFLDAVTQATHDSVNNPSVISISWGGAEAYWTSQSMQAMNQAFQAAATLGITICCAAGDSGSSDGVYDRRAHVDFPSSSPYVLGCGGTRLQATGTTIASEVVWNDNPTTSATGGGVSDVFALPMWQANAQVPPSVNTHRVGRGVPDIAGNADPQTGYQIRVDGQNVVFGGTSAVAPLWAGLIALINQQRGQPIGYLNPILYQKYSQLVQANALRDITSGNNGAYSAKSGWDPCTGLGSPNGANLLSALLVP